MFHQNLIFHQVSETQSDRFFEVYPQSPVSHRGAASISEASQPHVASICTAPCQLFSCVLPACLHYFTNMFKLFEYNHNCIARC